MHVYTYMFTYKNIDNYLHIHVYVGVDICFAYTA